MARNKSMGAKYTGAHIGAKNERLHLRVYYIQLMSAARQKLSSTDTGHASMAGLALEHSDDGTSASGSTQDTAVDGEQTSADITVTITAPLTHTAQCLVPPPLPATYAAHRSRRASLRPFDRQVPNINAHKRGQTARPPSTGRRHASSS